ncbi:MAG: YHYH protein [Bacteroidetes bacterium]|nr:YHYH protein [Bacteroidota bacterium]
MNKLVLTFCLMALLAMSCQKSSVAPSTSSVPAVYKKIYGATDMYVDGNYLVIKSSDQPDHKSPYYSGSKYEAYNGTNSKFQLNPNSISTQSLTFRIPLNPVKASSSSSTPLGSIGISLNGVPFYNQYAGPNQPLTSEINSFDQYNGHPQMTGQYHYHVEPLYLTTNKGKDALLGFLLDGFPVYGPLENGKTLTDADLDALHGHTGITTDYPSGIYHYHITADAPYINGDGFYGTPGTVSN